MEKKGLVIRKVDSDDRRNNGIYHTEKADELWGKMLKCALKIREISVKEIPEQNINIMRNVLEKICQNLRLKFNFDCKISDNTVVIDSSTRKRKKN